MIGSNTRYKSYNQEYLNPQPKVTNYNTFNQPQKQVSSFNNFDNIKNSQMMMQSNYSNYNQHVQQPQSVANVPIVQVPKPSVQPIENMSIDDIGDLIYSYCEKLYPR